MATADEAPQPEAGPSAAPQRSPDMDINEVGEALENLGFDKEETTQHIMKHVAAKAVSERSGEPANRPGLMKKFEDDAKFQRYKQMQLGGPMSAERTPDAASGGSTPAEKLANAFPMLSRRRQPGPARRKTTDN